MKNLAYQALAAVLLLAIGFAGGWHAHSVSATAAQVKATKAEAQVVVADVQRQADTQHATAVAEQGKSVAMAATQVAIRTEAARRQLEITHVQFSPPAAPELQAPEVERSCPDPLGSAEFERLYDAAARGDAAPAAAGTAAR